MSAPDVFDGVEVPPWISEVAVHSLPDPIFAVCVRSFPGRPEIDPAETPYTRAEVEERIDYWLGLLSKAIHDHAKEGS